MRNYDVLLFDLDGTLTAPERALRNRFNMPCKRWERENWDRI